MNMEKILELNGIKRRINILNSYIRNISLDKLRNMFRLYVQKKRKKTVLKAKPFLLFTDVTNICNLRCPLCPTGLNLPGYEKGYMSFKTFKKAVDELSDSLMWVALYDWGEPFLNKDIFRMIEYAGSKRIITFLSTNANLLTDEMIRKIIDSGLDQMVISLDGTNEQTYRKYRIGGDFNKVITGIEKLVRMKRKLRVRHPFIEWQFLVMKHNENEIEQARKMASEIGVDSIHFRPINLCDKPFTGSYDKKIADKWLPADRRYRFGYDNPPLNKELCYWLWYSVFINWKGDVYPCCGTYEEKYRFGNIHDNSIMDLWNNEKYVESRRLFTQPKKNTESICSGCEVFKKA